MLMCTAAVLVLAWCAVWHSRHHYYSVQPEKKMTDEVKVEAAPGIFLSGNLNIPPGAKGIVVFAHGSGSGRFRCDAGRALRVGDC